MIDINTLTYEELQELNKKVVNRIKYLHTVKSAEERIKFSIGDRVFFQHKNTIVSGIIEKIMKKNIKVRVSSGPHASLWTCPPTMITKEI